MKGLAAASGVLASRSQAATPPRPNILYLHSHDTGRYIQPYGYNVPTPNLQKLAGEGFLFRQAFDAAPTCSPSRAALLQVSARIKTACWVWRTADFRYMTTSGICCTGCVRAVIIPL